MNRDGKLDLLLKELEEHKMSITGLSETRWKGEGAFNRGDHKIVEVRKVVKEE